MPATNPVTYEDIDARFKRAEREINSLFAFFWFIVIVGGGAIMFISTSFGDRLYALEHPAPPPSGDARSVNAP